MIHAIASTYGVLPCEVMRLSAWDLGVTYQVWAAAARAARHRIEQMANAGQPVFPAVVLHTGGL